MPLSIMIDVSPPRAGQIEHSAASSRTEWPPLLSAMKEAGRSLVIAAKKSGSARIQSRVASIDNVDDSLTPALEARRCEIVDVFRAANREVVASRSYASSKEPLRRCVIL
jgi:hypothetical protein